VRNSGIPGVEKPSWSPDGKTIIFDSDYGRTEATINSLFTIKPDGSALTQVQLELHAGGGKHHQLTHLPHAANRGYASWSPG
jgi:Tol biopolymer transport system component